jgi:DNA primase
MDLAVATLPSGLDPCDLLVRDGPEPFRRVLENAVDALEFKLNQAVVREDTATVEGARRVIDAVLGVIALAPALPGEVGTVKTQLMITRIARRLALKEETVWARLEELRRARRDRPARRDEPPARAAAPAPLEERQLLQVLLAEPDLVAKARAALPADEISHPGLRRLLGGLYALEEAGRPAVLDELRGELDGSALLSKAFELQAHGLEQPRREEVLADLLIYFQVRREKSHRQQLHSQLQAASDHERALQMLRELTKRSTGSGPDATTGGDESLGSGEESSPAA